MELIALLDKLRLNNLAERLETVCESATKRDLNYKKFLTEALNQASPTIHFTPLTPVHKKLRPPRVDSYNHRKNWRYRAPNPSQNAVRATFKGTDPDEQLKQRKRTDMY